ncbi:Tol [Fusarium acutatum]|uniref:Tol n=1 Tax=Fusarium acutatum TaxID=78861 RepID=A0A8H4NXI8_9HYPO|nr:Tol [Fusarium acutatum]
MPLLNQQYRHLTLRHEQRLLTNKPPKLAAGYAQFNSYYLPSLNAGKHATNVSQAVTATLPDGRNGDPNLIDKDHPKPRQRKTVNMPQQQYSTVLAPQYSLPEDAVVSVFPIPGHTAQPLTLPHIVLKDPHYPWERNVVDKDAHDADSLNSVPWLALVVFTAEELALDANERSDYLGIGQTEEPTETLGFTLNVKDATAEGKVPRPSGRSVFIAKPDDEQMAKKSSNTMNLITFSAALFHKLFVRTSKDKNGNEVTKGDIKMFRFLSHVRTVATDGMLSTAETDGEPVTFALNISPRIAPQTITTPTTLYAHLISLQGVHGCTPPDLSAGSKARVVMTSLYSWSYTSLPPDTSSVVHTLENLSKGLSVLHTDGKGSIVTDKTQMEKLVTKRQEEGFTLTRYRTITGEVTAAILRGPLVPVKAHHPRQSGMTFQTDFGTDLNILDPDLGLMDLSYSTAWQLGRTLAMGDPTFTTALARLRGVLSKEALSKPKQGVQMTLGTYAGSRGTVLSEAAKAVSRLQELNKQLASPSSSPVSTNRWRRGEPLVPPVETKLHSEHVLHEMFTQADQAARIHSRALNSDAPVNYHSIPTNPDYFTVQSWILDKLHLAGIPAHYLITDPSHVPPETLRFFHNDENWTEALIDGALSLANQSTSLASDDCVRLAIKKQLQDYIDTPLEGLGYCQQMPKYGFIIRSEILVQFPDLAVSAEFAKVANSNDEDWDKIKPQAPILVQRRLASDMMLVLFDRTPPNLAALEFTLPPHQQPFVIGSGLDRNNLKITHMKIYATNPENSPRLEPPSSVKERRMPLDPAPRSWTASEFVDIDSGVMNVEHYATVIHSVLKGEMEGNMYTAQGPTSAVFAIQLNEPIHTLRIAIPSDWKPTSVEDHHNPAAGAFTFHVPEFPAGKYAPKT